MEALRCRAGGQKANPTGTGANYLAVCDQAQGEGAASARAAAEGIRSVLAGTTGSFELDYPFHGPDGRQWFTMRVAPLPLGRGAAVVMHLDVTERHQAESALSLSEARARPPSNRPPSASAGWGPTG